MRIVLVRHGETEWSRDMRHTSHTDVPLTAVGRTQAAAAGRRLQGRDFSLVLCSPRARARDTCRIAGLSYGCVVDDDLVEWDYGAYEGRTTVDIRRERPGWDVWHDGAPGGEPIESAGRRMDRVIERALAADGDVAVFAHGHILRILGARWIGLPPVGGSLLALGTAAICELGFERERRVIVTWNGTG